MAASDALRTVVASIMPRWARMVFLGLAMALAACGSSQRVPRYDDAEGIRRVGMSLSPWNDGSPDRSSDGRTFGEPQSDRQVFGRWMLRYYENDELFQHDKDFQPFNVPSSVAEAIRQQRQYEAEQAARRAERQVSAEEEERVAGEARQRDEEQRQAAEAAEDANKAGAASNAAAEQAHIDAATAANQQADFECRERRSQAANQASLNPVDTQAAIARARASIRCPNDGPVQ